jgi:hypothetical protein
VVKLFVDANNDVIAVILADEPYLTPTGPLTTCPHTAGKQLVIAKFEGQLGTTASWAYCYGQNLANLTDAVQDAAGNMLLVGKYQATGATNFGDAASPVMLPSGTLNRSFIAKYGPDGRPLDAIAIGTTGANVVNDIDVDPNSGDIAIALNCQDDVDFGSGVEITVSPANVNKACIVELDAQLDMKWAYVLSEIPFNQEANAVAYLPNGDVLAGLAVSGQVNFGDTIWSNAIGANDFDFALVVLDGAPAGSTGTLSPNVASPAWRRFGSTVDDTIIDLKVHHATQTIFGAAKSKAFENALACTFNGVAIDGAAFVWRWDLAPFTTPVWLEASGTNTNGFGLEQLDLDPMGNPILIGDSSAGYNWGWTIPDNGWVIRLNR